MDIGYKCVMFESLTDLGMDDEGDDDPVPLPNVNAAILKKVQNAHIEVSNGFFVHTQIVWVVFCWMWEGLIPCFLRCY